MAFQFDVLKINTEEGILITYETNDPSSQQIGIIPLLSPGEGRLGIVVNLTWIRELHYLAYYGESLQKWATKFRVSTQEDVEELSIWPVVALDYSNEDIFRTLYSRCQHESKAYEEAQKISLNNLRHALQFEDGVTTTLMQYPELIALIDGIAFRFPEAYFIGDMTPITVGKAIRRDPDWYRSFDGLPLSWTGLKCELCGSSNSDVLHIIGPSRIVQCRECGLQYDNPQAVVEIDSLNKYASEFRDQRNSAKSMLRAEQNVNTLINILTAFNPNLVGQSILEIGCASGELLYLLEKKYSWPGEHLWGLDLSKRAVETAKTKFGLRHIFDENLKFLHFPDQKFNIVVLFNTIEHLPDPRVVLTEIHRILEDGGYVLIGSVPNVESLASQLFPEGFIAKNFPDGQHHYQFTPDTLSRLCIEAGYEVIRLDGETREPVLDKLKETAIWLSYSCGVPLRKCQSEKNMLKELRILVSKLHKEITLTYNSRYEFSIEEDDFLTAESLVEFWRREIWRSPYLSDEFDILLKKSSK